MDVDFTDTKGQNGSAENAGTHEEGAAEQQQQAQPQQTTVKGNTVANYTQRASKKPTVPSRSSLGGTRNGATSPERRAQSVPIDPIMIKLRHHPNRFQALADHSSADSDP
jgi:hypothetical protein